MRRFIDPHYVPSRGHSKIKGDKRRDLESLKITKDFIENRREQGLDIDELKRKQEAGEHPSDAELARSKSEQYKHLARSQKNIGRRPRKQGKPKKPKHPRSGRTLRDKFVSSRSIAIIESEIGEICSKLDEINREKTSGATYKRIGLLEQRSLPLMKKLKLLHFEHKQAIDANS